MISERSGLHRVLPMISERSGLHRVLPMISERSGLHGVLPMISERSGLHGVLPRHGPAPCFMALSGVDREGRLGHSTHVGDDTEGPHVHLIRVGVRERRGMEPY